MKDKKMIILSVIVCLIIILLGGTTAFFSQGQSSQVQNVVSSTPSLYYTDNDDYMKNNLIPTVQEDVIKFASKNSSNQYTDNDICKYNGEFNACSVYEFTIENTSDVSQEIITSLTPAINEYKNLYLMVVESDSNKISENKQIIHHQNIGQTEIKFGSLSIVLGPRSKKTYSIILYIKSMDYDQTSEDAGKRFGATININSVTTGYNISKSFGEPAITVDLSNGLIPVVYNENGTSSKWFVADTSQKWYDYNTQWWANAVSVDSSTTEKRQKYVNSDGTYKAGTEIAKEDMLAMFVWIPRFSYTIGCTSSTSCYGYKIEGASSVSQGTPGAINIKFVSKNTKEMYTGDSPTYTYTLGTNGMPTTDRTPSNWYTHPAFTFGSDELSGIWVGKFETSVNPSSTCYTTNLIPMSNSSVSTNCQASNEDVTPRILPNVLSLVYQTVYNQFETAKKFTSTDEELKCGDVLCNVYYGLTTNTDSHMMKNSEWGAVAYLSQSIYGKYGNANYEGANKEIYKNDSGITDYWARYTGRSQGLALATSSHSPEGTCKYNDIKINEDGTDGKKEDYKGTGASTTGNIYGIYDMSGGAYEYVMGYYTEASSEFGGRDNNGAEQNFSGFKNQPTPESKYFDGYKGTISDDTKTIDLFTKSNEVIGHATAETKSWYSDNARTISASYPWVLRGGDFGNSSNAGVFGSNNSSGDSSRDYSFRSVLATIES